MKIIELAKKTRQSLRSKGLKQSLKTIRNWVLHPEMRKENKLNPRYRYDNVDQLLKKIDFSKKYTYGSLKERINRDKIVINWLLSPFHIGSGGHQTIFRFIKHLSQLGYDNAVYITDGHGFKTESEAHEIINKHFQQLPELEVHFLNEADLVNGSAQVRDCDHLIATRYNTVYYALLIENCRKRFYFVQDLEHMFYAVGYEHLFALNTYGFGLHGICASPWLAQQMRDFGMEADYFYLGYDPEVYFDRGQEREPKSIAFYARFESERRVVELGMLALEIVQKQMPDLKIYLYGSSDQLQGYDLQVTNLGVVNYTEMNDLFNRVEIGLSFSMTNYGLTPTEMMAAGLPVIELAGDNTEAIFNSGENIILAERNPDAVARAIVELIKNSQLRSKIKDGGLNFAKEKSWDKTWSSLDNIFEN